MRHIARVTRCGRKQAGIVMIAGAHARSLRDHHKKGYRGSEQGLQLRGICALIANVPPWVLLAPIATIRSGAALTAMLAHISAAMAGKAALPRQRAMAVPSVRTARNSFALYLVCGTARMARSISAWIFGLLSMAMWEMPTSPPRLMFESLP